MTDDLVRRLRDVGYCSPKDVVEAADYIERLEKSLVRTFEHMMEDGRRVEKLEAALHQWDHLIAHEFTGSRAAMSAMHDAAQITAALLHGEAPWPETRIEKLEAALREISSVSKVYVAKGEDMAQALTSLLCSHRKIALAALEGKDD
jgi:hypothetical protein